MKKIDFLLKALLILNIFTAAYSSNNIVISSPIAISQAGRFAINSHSPLRIDKQESLKLTNFIAYQLINTKNYILIGAIPGEENLKAVCEHPNFLEQEGIDAGLTSWKSTTKYFYTKNYHGCWLDLTKSKAAIIIARPKPFVSENGDKINYIGMVGNSRDLAKLKSDIYFQITAKDFFINLLQLSQAFSPFSNKIDWDRIKSQGLLFIGNQDTPCRGLSAAARFLIPALNKQDFHSFISLKGLGSRICPAAPIPKNENMQKWLSVPETTRNIIVKYSTDYHGYTINKHISYFYLPAIEAFDPEIINAKIKLGREALTAANIDKTCGVIVDLRFNLGGNLQSMLLTLGGLIPSGQLFSLGRDSYIYLSKDGNKLSISPTHDLYGQYNGALPTLNRNKPIAILTNWMTASSGELTSLVLRNSPRQVRAFGTKTSPTASVNATFYLIDGNTLNLMVDRVYNNQGKIVPLSMPVDKQISDNLQTVFDPKADMAIIAARKWLESLPGCSNLSSVYAH